MDEPRAALLLAVDEDLGLPVDLLEVEVAAVEEDLRVVLGDPGRVDSEKSLPSDLPMVVTALWTLYSRGPPCEGKYLRVGIRCGRIRAPLARIRSGAGASSEQEARDLEPIPPGTGISPPPVTCTGALAWHPKQARRRQQRPKLLGVDREDRARQ